MLQEIYGMLLFESTGTRKTQLEVKTSGMILG